MYFDMKKKKKSEDKLHRTNFVNSIVKSINNYPSMDESIVIGLMGDWGTGKSSIINMIESELDEEIIVLKFNPWNYPSQNQLISSFFDELSTTFDKYDFNSKIKKHLSKYKSKMFDSAIDIGSSYFKPLKFLSIFNKNDEYNTLNDLKSSLKDSFKKQKKILVIIDDIDRLNPTEVREIFQLVKSLADFPNIIYLLAFDKDYVNHALKDWNINSDDYSHSEDFIDKIVQVPLVIPKFDDIDLYKVFSSKIDILKGYHENVGNMNKELIFKGVGTALITPTNEKGIDFDKLEKLIDFQIENGINALIIAGTTGEGSTLDDKEHKELLSFSKDKINHRVPMVAGVGSNDTNYACSLAKYASEIGADGLLVVTPYYNKATQYGLIQSYTAIAKASTKPLILYNVPSRTGVNIEPETYLELSKVDNIVGIKEANGNLAKIMDAFNLVGDKLYIYSGNDDEITPFLSMGGYGVISVLSNMLPKETVEICDSFFAGDVKRSKDLQLKYLPLIRALFSEVNPIPIKSAMAKLGFCENYMRLPLTPMNKAKEEKMFGIMKDLKII